FSLATLAGQAQVQRLENVFILPTITNDVAANHLIEDAGAAPRRMLLFERRHVARAHGSAFEPAADARADTALGCVGEAEVVGGFAQEFAPFVDSRRRFQIECYPGMYAALSEMAIERTLVVVLLKQSAKLAQISSQFFGWNRRVLPTFVIIGLAGNACCRP